MGDLASLDVDASGRHGSPRANSSGGSGAFSDLLSVNGTRSVARTSARAEDFPRNNGFLVLMEANVDGVRDSVPNTGGSASLCGGFFWSRLCISECTPVAGTHGRCNTFLQFGKRLTAMIMYMLLNLPTKPQNGVRSSNTTRARLELRNWTCTPGCLRLLYRGVEREFPSLGPTEASWQLP